MCCFKEVYIYIYICIYIYIAIMIRLVLLNVYLDHLMFCVVCINGQRYVCCGECYVIFDECYEPTSCFVQPIVAHGCEVMYFGCFHFRVSLVS